MTCRAGSGLNSPVRVDLRPSARGRALGTPIGTIAAPTKVLVSGEGVALASVVLDTAADTHGGREVAERGFPFGDRRVLSHDRCR